MLNTVITIALAAITIICFIVVKIIERLEMMYL